MIEAVIFDFDGTLADTSEFILNSFQAVYKLFQGEEKPSEYISEFFGEPLKTTIEREFKEPFEEVFDKYKKYQSEKFSIDVKLFDNAIKTLEYLKNRKIKLAVVTSRMRNSILNALKELKINQYFEVIISVDDTENHKPHKEPLMKAMTLLGVSNENTLYVGDSKFDMECANNASTLSALTGWHSGADKLKGKYLIDYVIDNLWDITNIV
ncbi:HAD-IA family hydrolase [Sedimentibacter sp. zth1]|uniref:HAD family hydrolase n=1 Tax=Sedimentibacter sp. zth1 TaxID=2816908 RepID=UPI001A926D3D|nr:HAD-IA family hydrolase [Sedimentibacter sp. zth1]QSX06978.1 HAD-IA family hydrolase [Sedimentibacter sp. zth1]